MMHSNLKIIYSNDYARRFSFALIALLFYGILMQYSAAGGEIRPWASNQLLFAISFLPVMLLVVCLDLDIIKRYSYLLFLATTLMLVLVKLRGYHAMGATRWLNLGFIRLQPSELAKISIILALARYFADLNFHYVNKIRNLLLPLMMVGIPFMLILVQPDLGTAMIVLILSAMIIYLAGVSNKYFLAIGGLAMAAAPILWQMLHKYQKQRIIIFLNPESDPLGSGYNIIQSKIAIGSGGIWGQGLTNGLQTQLDYLPEHHTDFAFTMLAEELGLVGALVLLGFFIIYAINAVRIIMSNQDYYSKLLASGAVGLVITHVVVNISMVMGLIPVVGVPLPFISYGRTNMMTTLLCSAIILNVAKKSRRSAYEYYAR